jgi:hypothetical protein
VTHNALTTLPSVNPSAGDHSYAPSDNEAAPAEINPASDFLNASAAIAKAESATSDLGPAIAKADSSGALTGPATSIQIFQDQAVPGEQNGALMPAEVVPQGASDPNQPATLIRSHLSESDAVAESQSSAASTQITSIGVESTYLRNGANHNESVADLGSDKIFQALSDKLAHPMAPGEAGVLPAHDVEEITYGLPSEIHYDRPGGGVPPQLAAFLLKCLSTDAGGDLAAHLDNEMSLCGEAIHGSNDSGSNHGNDHVGTDSDQSALHQHDADFNLSRLSSPLRDHGFATDLDVDASHFHN